MCDLLWRSLLQVREARLTKVNAQCGGRRMFGRMKTRRGGFRMLQRGQLLQELVHHAFAQGEDEAVRRLLQ